MAEYRTVRMSFWSDPYIENLSSEGKLLYIYLFTCPNVNNLGFMEMTVKRISYETDIDTKTVEALLSKAEKDGKLIRDGNCLWLTNFIKNQCTTSPMLLKSMQSALKDVQSQKILHAINLRYPHLFEDNPDLLQKLDTISERQDTLSIPYQDDMDSVGIPPVKLKEEVKIEKEENPPLIPPLGGAPSSRNDYPDDFEQFWKAYPNRVGKGAAYRSWKSHKKILPPLPDLISAIEHAKQSRKWKEGFIPNPSTWLNQCRWDDEDPEQPQPAQGSFMPDNYKGLWED